MALTYRAGLLALVGALVVGLAFPYLWAVWALAGIVLALVALDLGLAGSVRRLVFTREGDATVRLGNSATVGLLVANPGGRRVRGLLRDAWAPSAGAVSQRHRIDLPTGERRRVTTELRPTRRGDRQAYRITVRALGPLGLAGRQSSHTVPWTVRVLPPFESRKHLPSRLARLRELDGRAAVLVRGQGTEFDSLRDYVVGDDVRSIDWRATARRSNVVVRTWRPERDRHVLVVLDTGRTSAGRVGDGTRLDHALDASLLLAALATRAGDRVDLLAYDRRVRADVRRTSPGEVLARFTSAMAMLEPELVETDHRGLVTEIGLRASQRSLVVLLTGLDGAVISDGLLPVLGVLLRRHEVLIASVADPRIDAMAHARSDTEAVYGAAAAERTRGERRRTIELLERHGATVVDATPDRIAPDLADTYLALKQAGRL